MSESGPEPVRPGAPDREACVHEFCDRLMYGLDGPVPWQGCAYPNRFCVAGCIPEIDGGTALYRERLAAWRTGKTFPQKDPT